MDLKKELDKLITETQEVNLERFNDFAKEMEGEDDGTIYDDLVFIANRLKECVAENDVKEFNMWIKEYKANRDTVNLTATLNSLSTVLPPERHEADFSDHERDLLNKKARDLIASDPKYVKWIAMFFRAAR